MRKRVLILLSTYNGEKFLRSQLDSIMGQKEVDLHLLVRDDGSTDSTVAILEEYGRKDEINRFSIVRGENIGWQKSFFSLLENAKRCKNGFDYFAFADQDDVWMDDKLKAGIELLDNINTPVRLYCSNLYSFTEGEIDGIIDRTDLSPDYYNCLLTNRATGCTAIFSKGLLELMETPKNITVAHDHWMYMVATLCGEVIVDSQPHIKYRLHESNQIGNRVSLKEIWTRRIKENTGSDYKHYKERLALELLRIHSAHMNRDAKNAITKIARYRNRFKYRLDLMTSGRYTMGNRWNDLFFKIKVLLGKI